MTSNNDKVFKKRQAKNKENLARRKSTLQERRRALVICEGKKTEPFYIKNLAYHLGLTAIDIEISGDCDSAPISVVEYGIEKLKLDSDFDLIFFVFDRDTHSSYDETLNIIKALQNQKKNIKKTFMAITSVPCFEIWFLLHFEFHSTPYVASKGKSPCENLISLLKKMEGFENYSKGKSDYFDLLFDRIHQAKRNSALTLKQSLSTNVDKHHGNSSTLMHIFVEELEKLVTKFSKCWKQYKENHNQKEQCKSCLHFKSGKTSDTNGECNLVIGSINPLGRCISYSQHLDT